MKQCELKIYNNQLLLFCLLPIYLRVKPDRLLTFRFHRLALRKKTFFAFPLLRRLAPQGGCWCQDTTYSCFTCDLFDSCLLNPVFCPSGHTCFLNVSLLTLCAKSLDASIPLQKNTNQFLQKSIHLI